MAESLAQQEALIKALVTGFKDLQTSRFVAVAGYSILLYDHFLTFPTEVALIWRKPKSTVSYAFLFNRYAIPVVVAIGIFQIIGLAANVPHRFCHIWLYVEGSFQIICYGIAHFLASLRVRALHSARPWVDRILWISGALYALPTIATTFAVLANIAKTYGWDETTDICTGTPLPWMYWCWIPGLLLEIVLFGLIILKAVRDWRRDISFPITRLLYRDGFLYFGMMAACSVFNIIAWSALRPTLFALAKYFAFTMVAVMSSRIVLNLRTLRQGPSDPSGVSTDAAFELGALSAARRSAYPGATQYGTAARTHLNTHNPTIQTQWSRSDPSSEWPNDTKGGERDLERLHAASVAVTISVDVHRQVDVNEYDDDSADDSRWRSDEKKRRI
ncbi:hypothetical protein FRB90_000370 [Tulasnella sp. 427]|nr:hypothetical protein FRB90_000370 [Tulasnella sp. 427]